MGMKIENGVRWRWLCAWGSIHVKNNRNEMKEGWMDGGGEWYRRI